LPYVESLAAFVAGERLPSLEPGPLEVRGLEPARPWLGLAPWVLGNQGAWDETGTWPGNKPLTKVNP
jgi:hypothetical protein